jgi:hypothetical protein
VKVSGKAIEPTANTTKALTEHFDMLSTGIALHIVGHYLILRDS